MQPVLTRIVSSRFLMLGFHRLLGETAFAACDPQWLGGEPLRGPRSRGLRWRAGTRMERGRHQR